jgi:pimeloyl-ACP methyl ester carboxylesterase
MQGTADRLFPFEGGQFIAEQIPDALFYTFKGRGHLLFLQALGEFCDVLRQFVLTEAIPSQESI